MARRGLGRESRSGVSDGTRRKVSGASGREGTVAVEEAPSEEVAAFNDAAPSGFGLLGDKLAKALVPKKGSDSVPDEPEKPKV
jgi:hypothetical protein